MASSIQRLTRSGGNKFLLLKGFRRSLSTSYIRSTLWRPSTATRLIPYHLNQSPAHVSWVIEQKDRFYSTQTTDIVFPDPNRPDLFYHFVNPPTPLSSTLPAFALSFIESTPPSVDSSTVIGWLPAQTYVTDSPEEPGPENTAQRETQATLQDFVPNGKFVTLLHKSIAEGLRDGVDDVWNDTAMGVEEGWMHINDQRNIPALNRVGDPDDIIGSVLVEAGKIKPETYQAMPSYRICTQDGVLQLTEGLAKHLKDHLVKLAKAEKAV
ncbi:hypothetical protein CVT24_012013 [Panaeolus cyanescens]|uniref:Uncharacterized protein n=1 Tax=Panaeolus cyanescens TaxID=181874 RepID=A0A409YNJ0_9AGAR|nr:hypothetical protein CVT24_012013 [Panaeolus cyanescens]